MSDDPIKLTLNLSLIDKIADIIEDDLKWSDMDFDSIHDCATRIFLLFQEIVEKELEE